jgi:hypothetical protein
VPRNRRPPSFAPGTFPRRSINPAERFTIYFGLWLGNMVRGELRFAREIAETFLREGHATSSNAPRYAP